MHENAETVIGAHASFKGDLETNKPLRIDGRFEGRICSESLVMVSEDAEHKGDMRCSDLHVDGTAEGTIVCSNRLELTSKGAVTGVVTTKNLVLVPGALLNGQCNMI